MRSRFILAITAVLVVASLVSCDLLTGTNLFKLAKLGQISQAQLEAMDAETLIENIGVTNNTPSDSFFTAFAEAPATTQQEVLGKLQDYFDSDPEDPLWQSLDLEPKALSRAARNGQTPQQREQELVTLAYLDLKSLLKVGKTDTLLSVINTAAGVLVGKNFNDLDLQDVVPALRAIPSYLYTDQAVVDLAVTRLLHMDQVFDELSLLLDANADTYLNPLAISQKRDLAQAAAVATVMALYDPLSDTYLDESNTPGVIPAPYTPGDAANLALRLKAAMFLLINNPSFVLWSDGTKHNLRMLYNYVSTAREFKDLVTDEGETGSLSHILIAAEIDFEHFSL